MSRLHHGLHSDLGFRLILYPLVKTRFVLLDFRTSRLDSGDISLVLETCLGFIDLRVHTGNGLMYSLDVHLVAAHDEVLFLLTTILGPLDQPVGVIGVCHHLPNRAQSVPAYIADGHGQDEDNSEADIQLLGYFEIFPTHLNSPP